MYYKRLSMPLFNILNTLHKAAEAGNVQALNKLLNLKQGQREAIDKLDGNGYSALFIAAINHKIPCLIKLLEAGANPYTRQHQGDSLLHIYIYAQRIEMLKLFIWFNIHFKQVPDQEGVSALSRINDWDSLSHGTIWPELEKAVDRVRKYNALAVEIESNKQSSKEGDRNNQLVNLWKIVKAYGQMAEILEQFASEVRHNALEMQQFQADAEFLINYYHSKCLQMYQNCFEGTCLRIPQGSFTLEQQALYLQIINKFISYAELLGDKNAAQQARMALINFYFRQAQLSLKNNQLEQAEYLARKTIPIFEKIDLKNQHLIGQFYANLYQYLTGQDANSYQSKACATFENLATVYTQQGDSEIANAYTRIQCKLADFNSSSVNASESPAESGLRYRRIYRQNSTTQTAKNTESHEPLLACKH